MGTLAGELGFTDPVDAQQLHAALEGRVDGQDLSKNHDKRRFGHAIGAHGDLDRRRAADIEKPDQVGEEIDQTPAPSASACETQKPAQRRRPRI